MIRKKNDMPMQEYERLLLLDHPFTVETDIGWEKWVVEPCIKTSLTPRHAKALLELAGIIINPGVPIEYIIERITSDRAIELVLAMQEASQYKTELKKEII